MVKLGTVVLGAEDVRQAVDFWSRALGYEPVSFPDSANEFTILVPPSGVGTRVALQRADTPVQDHPRVHLDLVVDNAAEQASEIDRLIALGATQVDWDLYPPEPDFVVLADPVGNRFCIVDKSHRG
ncbi:MAG: VOC family protein [Acidimicrobiia bacterium]|nr:VOC family protein [Acidimicrobiia bacterium]